MWCRSFPQVNGVFLAVSWNALTSAGIVSKVADMSNRVLLPLAVRAIREAKAQTDTSCRVGHFAAACLVSSGHLSNIEAGRKRPTQEFIYRLATQLDVPVDAISYANPTALEATA